MSEGRRGLGRGLSALLDEAAVEAAAGAATPAAPPAAAVAGAREIPIELIAANPDQPRRTFREEDLAELVESIREKGVLQPILVRPAPGVDGEFQIVAGERRWRAAQRAGVRVMPAVVRELDDLQVLEIAIIENVQRADLTALEEALGYKALIDRFGRTQEAVAQAVGKSRPYVANALRLLTLPTAVQDHLAEGRLTAGHIRALVGRDDAEALADEIVRKGLNVRDTEALARKGAEPKSSGKTGSARPGKDADTEALEADISAVLGIGVEINDRGGAGTVVLSYQTLEQLDDLCRRLTRS
ncbi:MAG: ParB/RepB/Spo0J family partition protein [Caulobacterales bacterium]|nr:ParB/RepB/Spo0J family partition protein [Caulobacterales bacterium]